MVDLTQLSLSWRQGTLWRFLLANKEQLKFVNGWWLVSTDWMNIGQCKDFNQQQHSTGSLLVGDEKRVIITLTR